MMNDTESTGTKCASTFKLNQTVFDSENKEFVLISNGIPCDEAEYQKTGALRPTEAIAIRFLGLDEHGVPCMAMTYRKVNADRLSALADTDKESRRVRGIIERATGSKHYNFVGRV